MRNQTDLAVQVAQDLPQAFDLKKDFVGRLIQLMETCVKTRGAQIEYNMQLGRDLSELTKFCEGFEKLYDWCLEKIEIEKWDAARKIRLATTWDAIKMHIESKGLSTPFPRVESHMQELCRDDIPILERGRVWEMFHAQRDGSYYTAKDVAAFVEKYKALPVPSEVVGSTDSEDGFEYAPESKADVPQGTREAQAHVVGPDVESGDSNGDTGSDDSNGKFEFVRPEGVRAAIEKIAGLCGAGWGEALNKSDKVSNEDVLAWAGESQDNIRAIAGMVGGPNKTGIRQAIKIIHKVVDDKTPIWQLKQLALGSENHKYIYESMDGFRVTTTDLNIRQK